MARATVPASNRPPRAATSTKFLGFAGGLAASLALGAGLGFALPATSLAQDTPAAAEAPASRVVTLAPDAPERYTVLRGDTLWDISARFLRDPWLWPEIWHVNPQVQNPHLIYPGDELVLSFVDGRPRVTVERGNTVRLSPEMRSTPLDGAIPVIPYEVIAAFMSKPSVIAQEEIKQRPYVVALRDRRLVGAAGGDIYANKLPTVAVGSRYNLVHVGDPLKDPETGDKLGYQGVFTGVGRVERNGKPAKLMITESARETLAGDLLFSENLEVPLDFIPHAPSRKVDGQIISVVDGVSVIGQYQVVVINRGKRDGLEPGHVLAIQQAGEKVKDPGARAPVAAWSAAFRSGFAKHVQLPAEHAGVFLVFKAYDRLSYGLIVQADGPIRTGDMVGNP